MKQTKAILLFTALSLMLIAGPDVWGQEQCGTMEQDKENRQKFPEMGSLDELERAIQMQMAEIDRRALNGRTEAVVLTIPVVFHVLHNGEDIGKGTNLSAEQIQAQIQVLNEDFRRALGTNGHNAHPDGADIEVEFCLASIDEVGGTMSEPGIDRIRGSKAAWTREAIEGELKPLTIWNPNYYYNIWTVDFDTADELLLGYAQFPGASNLQGLNESGGPASTDGVVLRYSVCGSAEKGNFPVMQAPHNLGRTLTHETGHWLGLRHIWGDGACNADDFVADTPTSSGPHRGCPIGVSTCNSIDMIENYMDYTDDACMNIFTKGQKARVLAVLELSPRRGILAQSPVCGALVQEPPVANFTSDKRDILLGGTVKFTDLSSNFPTSRKWTFEGGNPSVSVEKNPVVTYEQPGTYSVGLVSSNDLGDSPPLDSVGFVTVSDQGLCNSLTNFGTGTNSVLSVPTGEGTGFISGHNSLKQMAVSEFFANESGYTELSGAYIHFGHAFSQDEKAVATVTVWNALGPQNAPARILEEKEILFLQIKEDMAANRPTYVSFDRRVPIFLGTPFHIGVTFDYNGDSLAVATTADGQATNSSSWTQDVEGVWKPYAIRWGYNVAHNITAEVGMKPSVHISPSKIWAYPGQQVILNGSGASIFTWNSDDGAVVDELGPQITVIPRATTIYSVKGSGLDLCIDQASVTVYVMETPLGLDEVPPDLNIKLFPNPTGDKLNLYLENQDNGELTVRMIGPLGNEVFYRAYQKPDNHFQKQIDVSALATGIYLIQIRFGDAFIIKRVVVQ